MIQQHALQNKVAIVTGSSRGIGRSIALMLVGYGAKVTLAARDPVKLEALQQDIKALGQETLCVPTDMSLEGDIFNLISQTIKTFGRLDIVINNAGLGIYDRVEKTSTESWDKLLDVNARGPFILCREAIPYLRHQKRSFIINIASVVGVRGYANQAAYTASKHALMGFSKALAKEVQSDGIRVHVLLPGGVDTDMVSLARPDLDKSLLMKPEEIAEWILFLVTRQGNATIDEVLIRREASVPWG
jgi:3-oxoacyl-[acyl-carrier protein] reductase